MRKTIEQISKEDGRFGVKAFKFVYEGLGYTIENLIGQSGHIEGKVLCEGLSRMAIDKWGKLAMVVLESWNIRTTRDFGEIVYSMIENKWMSAKPSDSISDFDDIYDFKKVFKDAFKF